MQSALQTGQAGARFEEPETSEMSILSGDTRKTSESAEELAFRFQAQDWVESLREQELRAGPNCPKGCGAKVSNQVTLRCDGGCDLRPLFETWQEYEISRARRDGVTPATPPLQPQPVLPRSYLLRDLLSDTARMTPPKMLVKHLVRVRGVTLFHGREKIGKSTIVGQLVAAITTGGSFLDGPLDAAFVVWVACDEPMQDAGLRLQRYGANVDRVRVVDGRVGPDDLLAELEGAKPQADGLPMLVVVDTLAELISPMITSENDSAPMIKALRLYIDVIRRADAACILIHHSNKSGTEYRGSQAIGGIVDAVVHFRERYAARAEPGEAPEELDTHVDTRRVLDIRSRWDGHTKRHLAFDAGQYKLGDVALPLDVQITTHLSSYGATSGSAITNALNVKKQAVFDELKRLTTAGIVVKSGNNNTTAYRMADTSPQPKRERAWERADVQAPTTTKSAGTGKERRRNGLGTRREREVSANAMRPVPEPPSKPVVRELIVHTRADAPPAA